MSDIIVGIDLGTTNSVVAIVQEGKPKILPKDGQKIIPSVVGYGPQGDWLVGHPALNQYTLHPENTARSVKRKMGSHEQIKLGKHEFSPQEISAFILRELKTVAENNLGQAVNKAVITVPAYFTNSQRQATKEAGEIAGLEVVRIINEPTAAALAYGLDHEDNQIALVYDLGGGTFDVSLVEMNDGVVEVLASHGDTHLGGDDFDMALAEHIDKLFYKKHQVPFKHNRVAMARLERAASAAKVHLSSYVQADIREEYLLEKEGIPLHLDTKVERDEFEELIEELLERTIKSMDQVLKDAELSVEDIDRVLLVGGSTRMPVVWSLVSHYTGLEPDAEINPDEVVALGAAVQGAIIAGQPVDSILVDVTPYSLGIEAAMHVGSQIIPDLYNILIPRNTTIPVTKEQVFQTLRPSQTEVLVKVYQGESPQASVNTLLGEFMIKGLKPTQPSEYPQVNVCFDFDVNGMLHVNTTDRGSGAQNSMKVQATQARLSPNDIAEARERVKTFDLWSEEGTTDDNNGHDTKPELDEETQALLKRGKVLLENGQLGETETATLKGIMTNIAQVTNQQDLDDLAEDLLDLLFDLE